MSGVEGLGRSVLPDVGAPSWAGELAGSLDHLGLQVTSENVLKVAAILKQQSEQLKYDAALYSSQAVVGQCGHDWVSRDAAQAFSPRLRALFDQSVQVANMLEAAADRLTAAASGYERVEHTNRAVFRGAQP